MANFSSVYSFIARDEFSRTAKKINAAMEKQAQKFNKSREAAKRHNFQIKKMTKDMRNLGLKMSAFVTIPFALMGRSIIKAASGVEETNSKFKAVFNSIEGSAVSAAKTYAKEFGVAESTAKKMLGSTGDLLTGFKFSEERALALSKQVAVLSGDLSAFSDSGMTAAQISKALTSGMLGETEAVKVLGIKIDQTTPKFNDMVKAKMKNENLDLAQAKSLIILGKIIDQTSKSVGAAKRSWDEYAQVAKRNAESTKNLQEKLGVLLLPSATKLTNALIRLTEWIGNLSPVMQKVVLGVGAFVLVIGPLLMAISLMIPAIGLLSSGFSVLTGSVAATMIAIRLMPLTILKTAMLMSRLVAGVKLLAVGLKALPFIIRLVGLSLATAFGPIGLIVAGVTLALGLLIAKWDSVKRFFGFDSVGEMKSNIDIASKAEVGGQIDVNFNDPKSNVKSVSTSRRRGPRLNTGTNTAGT